MMNEHARIEFLVARDGVPQTIVWVRRTMCLYRRAVLMKGNYANSHPYRRRFILAYCEFKQWLYRESQS
ncbi:hypothetical protein [Paraburkholderia sp. MM5384-R2]|uniref:hypothetical protein n=1 Tax=Paraburkholderia sp. MM5384-R2 TaxID=2723097 RepID=UPI0021A64D88|nr:hypothetical protein [Paraburkholderia sp. MM5384-R2]